MSCRIIGRYLENWILNEIKKIANNNKSNYLIFEFVLSKKNEVAKNFLKENNLKKININELKRLKKENNFGFEKFSEYYSFKLKEKINFLEVYEQKKQRGN